MHAYRYRRLDWRPGAVLQKPLSQSKIAVVTTAAFFRPDQLPFDESIRGGDYSFRDIPVDTDLSTMGIAHKSDAFDSRGVESDKNLALPLDRLRELAAEGKIGYVAPRHFSLMGSISAPARLLKITAPEIVHKLSRGPCRCRPADSRLTAVPSVRGTDPERNRKSRYPDGFDYFAERNYGASPAAARAFGGPAARLSARCAARRCLAETHRDGCAGVAAAARAGTDDRDFF